MSRHDAAACGCPFCGGPHAEADPAGATGGRAQRSDEGGAATADQKML
jgi:hypothetical protein